MRRSCPQPAIKSPFVIAALAGLLSSCAMVARSPVAAGTQATDHGRIGAGEGPVWRDGSLYFTDGTHINRLDAATGVTSVFKEACGSSNGLAFDGQGSLLACESKGRRVVRYGPDGGITVLAAAYGGKPFNSPNDLALDSKGRIYFTDPRYGPRDHMEMRDSKGGLVEGVYRIDCSGGLAGAGLGPVVARILGPGEVERPNGILVSPGDRHLYVCDNNNNTHGGARKLLRFDLQSAGSVKPGSKRVIFDWKNGRGPDGMKMDRKGRLYVAAGVNQANQFETDEFKAGCYILSPEGRLIDFVPTAPDEATNCAFGGADFRTLYITSGNHLWSLPLKATGWRAGSE